MGHCAFFDKWIKNILTRELLRIDADHLIPGDSEPVRDATVIVRGDTIEWVGPTADAPCIADGTATFSVPHLMPGLWDCHTHMTGLTSTNLDDVMHLPVAVAAARSVCDAGRAIQAGVTSVREVGGYGIYLARVVDEGSIPGPHIYAAGDLISPTGGHADLHTYSTGCVADLGERGGWLHTCDGIPDCLRAVRLQLRRNAMFIKICASGGVLTTYDNPMHQQFSDEEMRAIVEEAARAERIVAAHCHGKAGIMAALRAGAKTIEHGTWLDDESAQAMKDAGAILVTTRFVKVRMTEHGKRTGIPDYAYRKLLETAGQHRQAVELAIKAGVTIAAGTDTLTSGDDTALPWGLHGLELALLVEAGMSPLAAIRAATATAPKTLGPQAPKSGQIHAGYDADLIAINDDPVKDIRLLTGPDNITHVWKGGVLVKSPPTR